MLPIVYEQHCQACHPLTFEQSEGTDGGSQATVVPHRQQPGQIHRFLEAFYFERLLKEKPDLLQQPFPPLPGKPVQPAQRVLADVLSDRVQRAEKQIYLGKKVCGECHYSTPAPEQTQPDRLKDLKIEPTQAPEVWFEKANFTHTPHRLLDCLACHPGADKRQDLERPAVGDLVQRMLLPGIENCLNCHSPNSAGGGAGQDCVECHRYHDGAIHCLAPELKFARVVTQASGRSASSLMRMGGEFSWALIFCNERRCLLGATFFGTTPPVNPEPTATTVLHARGGRRCQVNRVFSAPSTPSNLE